MSENVYSLSSQLDPMLVQEAMAMIQPAQRIALLAHEHPDGDCIGSALGFAHILRLAGKTCVPPRAHPAPRKLSLIPRIETFPQAPREQSFDLVIAPAAGPLR